MMRGLRRICTALLVLLILAGGVGSAMAAPEGQVTWGIHVSLVPTWFDPAETTGIVTPFMVMYALHDAMVKLLPGNPLAPSSSSPSSAIGAPPARRSRSGWPRPDFLTFYSSATAHHGLSVLRALRGREAQGEVMPAWHRSARAKVA